jgi:hypothetical protein
VSTVDRTKWPRAFGYIEQELNPLRQIILERALRDVEIGEVPPGSNLGKRVQSYLVRAGVPANMIRVGDGFWCAAWLGAVYLDAGARIGPGYASCDNVMNWAKKEGLWLPANPTPADMVLYGIPGDAQHIGLVTRWDRYYKRALEGNTTTDGFSRDGTLVAFKTIARQKVLGYVTPVAA